MQTIYITSFSSEKHSLLDNTETNTYVNKMMFLLCKTTYCSCLETVAEIDGDAATDLAIVTAPLDGDAESATSPLDWYTDSGTVP